MVLSNFKLTVNRNHDSETVTSYCVKYNWLIGKTIEATALSLLSICTVYVHTHIQIQILYVYVSMTPTIIYWTISIYPHSVQICIWCSFWSLPEVIWPHTCLLKELIIQSDSPNATMPSCMHQQACFLEDYTYLIINIYVYMYGPTTYIWKQSWLLSKLILCVRDL